METIKITDLSDVDLRCDVYLSDYLSTTRSQIKNYMRSGEITVNDKIVKSGYKLRFGDEISIDIVEESLTLKPEKMDIDVLFEDEHMVIIRKPQGLVVHPGAGNKTGTLVNGLLYRFKTLSTVDPERPGIVHRLDKDTSGLMIIAKTDEFHEKIVELFKNREIEKKYLAIVHGNLYDSGIIETNISRNEKNRLKMAATNDDGKYAKTIYKPLKNFPGYTLLDVEIFTGRTHQIRVHMAHINHPVVGDQLYGRKDKFNIKAQLLQAYYLKFIHPITNQLIEVEDEVPERFLDFEKKISQ